jgi:hypothetical protein
MVPFIMIGIPIFILGWTCVMYACGVLLMQAGLGSGCSVVLNSAGLMCLGAVPLGIHWLVAVGMEIQLEWWDWEWLFFIYPISPVWLCSWCALDFESCSASRKNFSEKMYM